ncbi:carbohydrate kinase [Aquimarina addita]|uniref:Carbohydrate kinase n=1 Tax=Aquimarina addita TaxID=870485 RepID=A0ABP6UTU6_9FLAO
MTKITCFGEVLWDIFPNHKKIGGAPLNVAIRLQSLKNNISLISSIGNDTEGREIIEFIKEQGINAECIQINQTLKTGTVHVLLNQKGSASYDIKFPRAWDYVQLTKNAIKVVKDSDAFIFGSLITRNDSSRDTLYALLELARFKIFDVNLREPYYTPEILHYLMIKANFIKFNDEEIFEIAKMLDSKTQSLEQNILFIAKQTDTQSICVTKGRHGAILYYNKTFYYNSGYQIIVVDTVGAGDSFLASLINKLLKGVSPQEAIDFACAVGALVASREGANPQISEQDVNELVNP